VPGGILRLRTCNFESMALGYRVMSLYLGNLFRKGLGFKVMARWDLVTVSKRSWDGP
jgi:hypothetical protein